MSPSLLPPERQAEGEGAKPLDGVDQRGGVAAACYYREEGDAKTFVLVRFATTYYFIKTN
jgi:hypothetical protein